jgi:hypothetical protein
VPAADLDREVPRTTGDSVATIVGPIAATTAMPKRSRNGASLSKYFKQGICCAVTSSRRLPAMPGSRQNDRAQPGGLAVAVCTPYYGKHSQNYWRKCGAKRCSAGNPLHAEPFSATQ